MTISTVTAITLIVFLGIMSQWIAWKISKPAIVIMSICGLVVGPLLNLIIPIDIMGKDIYKTVISLSVSLILFEGSLSLNFEEIKDTKLTVKRIVIFGALIAWILGSLAAYYIADLSITTSLVIGAILIVTGPTVILPLLRQAKLDKRVASILKWEGILVDPLGAIFAVLSLEVARVLSSPETNTKIILHFAIGVIAAAIIGYFAAVLVSKALKEHYFPEYLKPAIIVCMVITVFTLSELIAHETGLLAVTVLGVAMGNMKIPELHEILHFNENISILLTSSVFIMLTASLSRETLLGVFEPRILLFVASMLFVVRPLSIWISTIGTDITWQEKALVGWIAPRGIVALTVTGYFSNLLVSMGYQDAEILLALTFALVIVTVFAHGFSIQPLAKKLGVAHDGKPGLIIVGSNKFSVELANYLDLVDIPVLIVEYSDTHLKHAIEMDIEHHRGEILYEVANYNLDLVIYRNMLLNTPIPLYNIMVANEFTGRFGRNNVCIISVLGDKIQSEFKQLRHLNPTRLGDYRATYLNLIELIEEGYKFTSTRITNELSADAYFTKSDFRRINILKMNDEGDISFFTTTSQPKVDEGDYIVSLIPPDDHEHTEDDFKEIEQYEQRLFNLKPGYFSEIN